MKMASKIQVMWRLNKQREAQAKEEEEARLAQEEAEAEWADVIMARAELKEAEASGDVKRIAQAKEDLARETQEAEEAQENAERELREAEEAKAAAAAGEAAAAEARAAEAAALAKGKPRRPRPVTPPRKPGQKVLSAKTRRAISGRPAKKMSSSRSRPRSGVGAASTPGTSEAGSPRSSPPPPDVDIPEEIAIQQKLQQKKTFQSTMFGGGDGGFEKARLEEEENQPDWWQSEAGAFLPTVHPSTHPAIAANLWRVLLSTVTLPHCFSASDSPCASALTGEEKKIEYNSEDGELARIHVRVWDEKAYTVLKKVRNWPIGLNFDHSRTRLA